MSPLNFEHNCIFCQSIGPGTVSGKPVDWYICRQFSEPHIVCRYSPTSYWERSIMCIDDKNSAFSVEACKVIHRKEAQAIIKKED